MMKKHRLIIRFLSVFLCAAVLMSCTAAAFAVEAPANNWLEVLDFTSIVSGQPPMPATNTINVNRDSSWIWFDMPLAIKVFQVEIYVQVVGSGLTKAELDINGTTYNLSSNTFGEGLYRLYANVNPAVRSDGRTYFGLHFLCSGVSSLEVLSFRVMRTNAAAYNQSASHIKYEFSVPYTSDLYTGTNASELLIPEVEETNAISEVYDYSFEITANNAVKFDYMTYRVQSTMPVYSISCTSGTMPLPVEVSCLSLDPDLPDESQIIKGTYDEVTGEFFASASDFWTGQNSQRVYHFTVIVDLRSLSNNSPIPVLRIKGGYPAYAGGVIQWGCSGLLTMPTNDPITFWLQNIGSGLNNFYMELFGIDSSTGWLNIFKFSLFTRLDDIYREIVDGFNKLISDNGTGEEVSQQAAAMKDAVDQVHGFEEGQQQVLDNAMPELQASSNVTDFANAFFFMQTYANRTFTGMGNVSVLLTLPMFLGVFLFLCSRIPGATRWSSPPPRKRGK